MSYQVLARKYRPRTFDELVGQEHVSRALMHALDQDRLHHAYLFTGTRGVGKTTIARILSRCLNCEQGVSARPCGVCPTCVEIGEGRFVDLIEVDAASRTKVEDTRELLDNVQYAPTRGRYKVYLIDEVHMLSAHSFNALLKTLEEPPPHVKFLLATTDPQKLPVTVLSRCLQFSLKALPAERIASHLKHLLDQEMIRYDDGALLSLGKAAEGSMRDALSLTDQAIAFGGEQLSSDAVNAMLGTVDRNHVVALLVALAEQAPEPVLTALASVSEQSPDPQALLDAFIEQLHAVAVAQAVPASADDALRTLASAFSAEQIQLYYDIALRGRRDLLDAPDSRAALEMLLLRMVLFTPKGVLPAGGGSGEVKKPETAADSAQVAVNEPAHAPDGKPDLQALLQGTQTSSPVPSASTVNDAPAVPEAQAAVTGAQQDAPVIAQEQASMAAPASTPSVEPALETQVTPKAETRVESVAPNTVSAQPQEHEQPAVSQHAASTPSTSTMTVQAADNAKPSVEQAAAPFSQPATAPSTPHSTPPSTVPSEQPLAPLAEPTSEAEVGAWWAALVLRLNVDGTVRNLARNAELIRREDTQWLLRLNVGHQVLVNKERLEELSQALSDYFQRRIQVNVEFDTQAEQTPQALAEAQNAAILANAIETLQSDPTIHSLVDTFGGRLDESSVTPKQKVE